jgi:hypothetical protein
MVMLRREAGDTLKLLPLIPRKWMEDGKRITMTKLPTRFGPVSLHVESKLVSDRAIHAVVECSGPRKPKTVEVRLPHPDGQLAVSVEGGTYDPQRETVRIERFKGKATVTLRFN